MALQLLLNLIIAVVWMFLNENWTAAGFIIGFAIGAIAIGMMRRFWPHPYYMIRLWAIMKLLALFMKELIVSSYAVLVHIVRPKLTIRPGIFAYKTELKSDWEVTLLSCLICLTPGTLTMDVSRDGSVLYIHAMDIDDVDELTKQIKGSFEKAIMEVTR